MPVFVQECSRYNGEDIDRAIVGFEELFEKVIRPGQTVVLKPNWISHAHKYNPAEWQSVITHPSVITAVLKQTLKRLKGTGRIVIADGPQTQSSWEKLMERMEPEIWAQMSRNSGVELSVLDLRSDEWVTQGDVIIERRHLSGDPLGTTECDLGCHSEFADHIPGAKGYFGADYNRGETNSAHSGGHHKYRISRTVVSCDVFINLPKLKTHKKAGITACLKNIIGINTYKNWLPHYSMGTPNERGDQFPEGRRNAVLEGALLSRAYDFLASHESMGRWMKPIKACAKQVFGDTRDVVRSGNWYGNQTICRTILDVNKVLFYANPDGDLRPDERVNAKHCINIVDAIIAGEGDGPEAPDAKCSGMLVACEDPVATDAVCAKLMGFDWKKIPVIAGGFGIKDYRLGDCEYGDITIGPGGLFPNQRLSAMPKGVAFKFRPQMGWAGHIEES
jgi:uncharacterized protein (DUF362 family)